MRPSFQLGQTKTESERTCCIGNELKIVCILRLTPSSETRASLQGEQWMWIQPGRLTEGRKTDEPDAKFGLKPGKKNTPDDYLQPVPLKKAVLAEAVSEREKAKRSVR